ncbi:MAG: ABC transporter permease subunit [Bacillota bacterium]|nr:ABC transporter permease subunit [Bacillota bacterium]
MNSVDNREYAGRQAWLRRFGKSIVRYRALLFMLLPGVIVFILFNYLPMFGIVIAFKKIDYSLGILHSPFVGLENFRFLFATTDAFRITRNTLLYNAVFIICDVFFAVFVAVAMRELWQPRISKIYQTIIILPYFLSMVVVAYLVYGFLHPQLGFFNQVLRRIGQKEINWYSEPKYWPVILPLVHWWKQLGYKSVVYLAAIAGIDQDLYEAAVIDGSGKWAQIRYITIPLLIPTMVIMFLLALGNIFRADFGLFYQVTMNSTMLYEVTDVIDTYVYRALTSMNNIGMSSAASVFQSFVGAITVITANLVVRRIDSSQALF